MMRYFILIILGFIFSNISAQALSNGGFETWASGNPASWSTSHSCIAGSTLESQETNIVYQGSSAIKLVGGTVPAPANIAYPGFAHYGTAAYDNSLQDFDLNSVAFPYRPDSIQFAYEYAPSGNDSANVFGNLFSGSQGNIIGLINVNLGASASYRLVTVPVTYMSGSTPDSMNLTFYSGGLFPPVAGSTMYLDAVKFIYNGSTTGIEPVAGGVDVTIYPNPATSKLYINVSDKMVGSGVKVFSVLGNEVMNCELISTHDAMDVSTLSEGIYIYRIINKNDKTIYTGKFSKE